MTMEDKFVSTLILADLAIVIILFKGPWKLFAFLVLFWFLFFF